jgi:branched-chain amino acid transport system substrate-binding protein
VLKAWLVRPMQLAGRTQGAKMFKQSAAAWCVWAVCAVAPSSQAQQVRIGGTLPLTGSQAEAGLRVRDGYQLAVERKNADGGLLLDGKRVRVSLEIVDDRTDSAVGARELEKLIGRGVRLLLGTINGPPQDVESAVAERLQVPYVALEGSPGALQRGYQTFFSVLAPINQLATTLMKWIDEQQKAGRLPKPLRIAFAGEDTDHGRDFRRAIQQFVEANAGRRASYQVVFNEPFDLDTRDFKPILGRIEASKADVLLVDAHYSEFLAMHRQYTAQGMCHKVLSYGARGAEAEARAELPPGATSFLLSAVWWNPQFASRGRSREFLEAFQTRYDRPPDWHDALGHEAARALMSAIEQAGSVEPAKVRQALGQLRMESLVASGYLSFPKEYNRQAQYPFLVQQNLPDGHSPTIYPLLAAMQEGIASNPRCQPGKVAAP